MRKRTKERIKIFIVDEQPIVCYGLLKLFENNNRYLVCGTSRDVKSAIREIGSHNPEIVIIETRIENLNGLSLLNLLSREHPGITPIVYSANEEIFWAEKAIKSGAKGYITKTDDVESIIKAIEQSLDGKIYITEKLRQPLLLSSLGFQKKGKYSLSHNLTDREFEIFNLLGQGYKIKDIAGKLGISTSTVEYHRKNIREKMNLKNSAELLKYAIKWVQAEIS